MTNLVVRTPDEQTAITLQELEQGFAVAVRQRELLEKYIRERLTPQKHFYKVRDSDKPSLNKDGAELINLPHGYRPAYEQIGGPDQPSEGDSPYQITARCRLLKGEAFAGEGLGSASSHITKRTGERVVRQQDPGLRHNATLKMAQKSAYIAATLNATAASEFFTQDMEDDERATLPERQSTPSNRAAQPAQGQDQYLCPTHNVRWFKSGNMRNYAHPIGPKVEGQKQQWCDMPKEGPSPAPVANPSPADMLREWRQSIADGFTALQILTAPEQTKWVQVNCPLVPTDSKSWKPADWETVSNTLSNYLANLAQDAIPEEESNGPQF